MLQYLLSWKAQPLNNLRTDKDMNLPFFKGSLIIRRLLEEFRPWGWFDYCKKDRNCSFQSVVVLSRHSNAVQDQLCSGHSLPLLLCLEIFKSTENFDYLESSLQNLENMLALNFIFCGRVSMYMKAISHDLFYVSAVVHTFGVNWEPEQPFAQIGKCVGALVHANLSSIQKIFTFERKLSYLGGSMR